MSLIFVPHIWYIFCKNLARWGIDILNINFHCKQLSPSVLKNPQEVDQDI